MTYDKSHRYVHLLLSLPRCNCLHTPYYCTHPIVEALDGHCLYGLVVSPGPIEPHKDGRVCWEGHLYSHCVCFCGGGCNCCATLVVKLTYISSLPELVVLF